MNIGDAAYIDRKYSLTVVERIEIFEQKTGKMMSFILHSSARRALSRYLKERMKSAESEGGLLHEPLFKSQKTRQDGQSRITEQHT